MRFFLTTFFIGLFFSSFFAQDAKKDMIIWGDAFKGSKNNNIVKTIGPLPNGVLVLKRKGSSVTSEKELFLELYSKEDAKLKKAVSLDLRYKNKVCKFEDVVYTNGNLYLILSFYNLGQKTKYVFYQELDVSTLKVSSKLKILYQTASENASRFSEFYTITSKDNSKFLFVESTSGKKNESESFHLSVFDADLNVLWSKDVNLPYTESRFLIQKYLIDNEGNVYVSGRHRAGEDFLLTRKSSSMFKMFVYDNKGAFVGETDINMIPQIVTDFDFELIRPKELVCVGFYSAKNYYSAKGIFYFRFNPFSKEVTNLNTNDIPLDILTQGYTSAKVKKAIRASEEGNVNKQVELENFDIDRLVVRSDGGVLMVGEEYREGNLDSFDPYSSIRSNVKTYFYGDILVSNISPQGVAQWTARIPKNQETVDDGGYYSSYVMGIGGSKLVFLFNENMRNINFSDLYYTNSFRMDAVNNDTGLIRAEVDKKGQVKLSALYDRKETGVVGVPKISEQISASKIFVINRANNALLFSLIKI